MIHVLHLSSEKSWRGGEQQIAYLIEELEGDDIKNFVACRNSSAFELHCKSHGIPHISLNFSSSLNFITALSIKVYCKENNINIIHVHSSKSHSLALLATLMGNKCQLILSRRVDFPIKQNFISKWKYNHERISKIICVSNEIRNIISPTIKRKDKLIVIHSGIDLQKFKDSRNIGILHKEFNLTKDEKIIANVSAIAPHKDYYTFIKTASHFLKDRSGVSFFIIGDGSERKNIERYAEAQQQNDKIYFTGFRTDITDIMPEIDVLLITSKTEGLGTTILDAMANYIPVIATSAGGIPELVKHNETGLLYSVKDYKNLSNGLNILLNNQELRTQLTNNAFNHIQKNFTKEMTALKTKEVYLNISELD